MKRIINTLFILLAFALTIHAQAPESFTYQAVPRDANGNILQNQNISMKISILRGSSSGQVMYEESHTVTTNDQGLVNLNVGEGNPISGNFLSIHWENDNFYIKVEMDPNAGTNYQMLGTSKLRSVPYALHAKEADNTFSGVYNDLIGKPNLHAVATSGDYNDLINTPGFHTVATSGDYNDLMNTPNMSNYISISNPSAGDMLYYTGSGWSKLNAGNNGNVMKINNNGMPSWSSASSSGDNLGNHTLTQNLIMSSYQLQKSSTANPAMELMNTWGDVKFHDWVYVGSSNTDNEGDIKLADDLEDWDDTSFFIDPNDMSVLEDIEIKGEVIGNITLQDSAKIGDPSYSFGEYLMFDHFNGNINVAYADLTQDSSASLIYDVGNSGQAWDEMHASNYITSSDRRLKKNISQLNYGIEDIMKLEPVSYKLKKDPEGEKTRLGLIAQEVKPIVDNAVDEFDYDKKNGKFVKKENKYLGIDYMSLIPVLIKGIQDQQNKIDQLEQKLNAQQKQIDQLKSMIKNK